MGSPARQKRLGLSFFAVFLSGYEHPLKWVSDSEWVVIFGKWVSDSEWVCAFGGENS